MLQHGGVLPAAGAEGGPLIRAQAPVCCHGRPKNTRAGASAAATRGQGSGRLPQREGARGGGPEGLLTLLHLPY